MKRIVAVILVLGGSLFAQSNESALALKRDATASAAAWNKGDNQVLISFLAKRYFKHEGSNEQIAEKLRKEIEGMKRAFGVESIIVTIEDSKQVSKAQPFSISLVPMQAAVRANGIERVFRTFALGISEDEGLHWSFVPCYQQSEYTILALYPELKGQMVYGDTYLIRKKSNQPPEPTR